MKKSPILACIVLLSASIAQAQTPEPQVKQADISTWKTYNIKDDKVSASFPTHPAMTTHTRYERPGKKVTDRMVGAYADGVVYMVYSYENAEPRISLEDFFVRDVEKNVSNARDVKLGRAAGKEYSSEKSGVHATMWFFAANNRLYRFSATGAPAGDPAVKQFFSSITLDSKGEIEVSDGPGILLPGITVEDLPAPPAGISSRTGGGSALGPGSQPSSGIFTGKEVDTKARVVMKPEPSYTDAARQASIAGTVVLRVVFASNGAVVNIRTVQGLPHGLTEQAIGAARKIKFIPAMKDGKFASMWIQLEYNFNLY
ncbi:MAG TPA: energy transducer TonB [Pyrinomonadaceae bacterium]|nr:energy transducer TonB [Pyrinomonadaceae bacterium]